MIEVLKTNISSTTKANQTIKMLNLNFPDYKFNVDLDDCDKILRIENLNGTLKIDDIINFLMGTEIVVEVLNE